MKDRSRYGHDSIMEDGSDGTDLHHEVAAQPIDGQFTDNVANQYPLRYCIEAYTYPNNLTLENKIR